MKHLLGTLYFTPSRDKNDKPTSKYEGKIVGFIVRRDNGSEYEVREEKRMPNAKTISLEDVAKLKVGEKVQMLNSNEAFLIVQVFPQYGDVWIRHEETGTNRAVKHTELRRVDG